MRFFSELVLCDGGRRLPWWRLCVYAGAVIIAALWFEPDVVARRFDFTMDNHAMASLDRALNATLCGRTAVLSTEYNVAGYMSSHVEASYVPLPDLVVKMAGSVDGYCHGHMIPFVNEDNGLGMIYEGLLRVHPSFTADGLARALAWFRVGVIAATCALLLALGSSVMLSAAVAFAGVAVCRDLLDAFMAYSAHSLFFVMVLLNAAAMTVVLIAARSGRRVMTAAAAVVAGSLAALAVNTRASYLPVYLSFLLCGCWAASLPEASASRGLRTAGLIAGCCAAGYLAFQYAFVSRMIPPHAPGIPESTHHSIFHPLVLGLAEPANDLAKAEGIRWDDEVGAVLARRVTPGITLLAPGYDEALSAYYRGLWRRYPRQMIRVYVLKLRTAGARMIQSGRFGSPWMRTAMWPLTLLPNGLCLFAVFLASAVAGLVVYARRGVVLAFYTALLCLAGVLLYLESAIIMPIYYVSYHNYLLFIALAWSFLFYQMVVNGAAAAGRTILARSTARTR